MARRGVMTALQAALAGIGGAAGGLVQQEELKRKRQIEDEARTRQEMRDIVEAGERGFVTGEQLARQQEQGRRTTGSVVQNALLSALSPRAGVLPPPTAQDVGLASQALATAGRAPQRIVTAGGQEMFRAETPFQREERLGVLEREQKRMERMEERQYEQTFAADEARRRREERQEITPYQRAQLGIDERRLKLQEDALKQRQTDATWRQSKLPAEAQKRLSGFDSGVEMAAEARALIKEYPEAVGLKNMLWSQAVDRMDPQGVAARAAIEALSGEIRNQRFGGALTTSEAKFAERFLPGPLDRADGVIIKLDRLEKYLESKRRGIYSSYGGSYVPGRVVGPQAQMMSGQRGGLPFDAEEF